MLDTTEDVVVGALLDIAVRVGNSPKIVSPFGFRVIEWNGQRVLTPLTGDEYHSVMKAAGKPVDERRFQSDPAGWTCVATNTGCETLDAAGPGGCCRVFHQNRTIGVSCGGDVP